MDYVALHVRKIRLRMNGLLLHVSHEAVDIEWFTRHAVLA